MINRVVAGASSTLLRLQERSTRQDAIHGRIGVAMHELLTAEQAAATLQLSPKTIKGWLRAGKLTGCKIGRQWRVREVDLEAFIQASLIMRGSEPTPST